MQLPSVLAETLPTRVMTQTWFCQCSDLITVHLDCDRLNLQSLKQHLHVRLGNLPICPELTRTKLPRASDVGHFLSITGSQATHIRLVAFKTSMLDHTGTVIRTTGVKMLEFEKLYICDKCKQIVTMKVRHSRFS
jgi:DNA helicase MCM9